MKKVDWVKVNNTNSTVNKNTKIKLTAKNGYTLYYTTNGKTPTTKSSKISSKKTKTITISKNTTIKVVGYKYNTLVKKSSKNGKFSTVVKTLKYKVKSTNNDDKDDDKKDDDDKKEVFDEKNYTKYFTLSNDGSDGKRYIDNIHFILTTKGDYQIKTDCYREVDVDTYGKSDELLKGAIKLRVNSQYSSFTVYVYDKNGNQLGSKKFEYNIFDSSLGGRRGSEYVGYNFDGMMKNYTFKKPEGVNVRYKISEGTTQVITKDVETVSIAPAYAIIWQYYNETGESAIYGNYDSGLKF